MPFIPLWAILGLVTAMLSAAMMLLQEKLRVNGYALAFWNKVSCALVTLPFLIVHGLPDSSLFYVYLALTAALYAISDVIFFTGITKTNAGAVSRLVPVASVLGFLLWFAIDPDLFHKYTQAPVISGLIFLTLCLFAFFAFRLKKCTVTMSTLRAVWFVIFAATAGPLLTKLVALQADMHQALYAYVFFQAAMMMALWLGFLLIRRPLPAAEFFAWRTAGKGMFIGLVSACMVLAKFASFYYVDNPAYIPAIIALDSVMILGFYKLRSVPAQGDIASGLGIVACATALIVLKAQI